MNLILNFRLLGRLYKIFTYILRRFHLAYRAYILHPGFSFPGIAIKSMYVYSMPFMRSILWKKKPSRRFVCTQKMYNVKCHDILLPSYLAYKNMRII